MSRYSGQFILKGGLLLYLIMNERARATKDIDLLAKETSADLDVLRGIFADISAIPFEDAVIYDPGSVTAEKFEAMLYLAEINSRMKDFYDIYSLCISFDFDGRVLHQDVLQTILRRNTHTPKEPSVFDKNFANCKDKATQWGAFRRRTSVGDSVDFSEVVCTISLFLKPVYKCIVNETYFLGYWEKNRRGWTIEPQK